MTADEVIDSYVRDVAACLPRRMRQDTALELRALLGDDLAARSETLGRAPDRALALDLLRAFGRPAEVARRYHERPALIDAADSHHFIIWALGGMASLMILLALDREARISPDIFLQWLGLLVILFALGAWCRRRWPRSMRWTPRADPDRRSPGLGLLTCLATLVFPVFMYAAPETFARTLFLGQIPVEGLALTEAFRDSGLRLATLVLLIASAGFQALVGLQRRRVAWSHWSALVLAGLLGLLFPAHAATAVFVSATANTISAPFFGLIGALYLLGLLYEVWHELSRVSLSPAARGKPSGQDRTSPAT